MPLALISSTMTAGEAKSDPPDPDTLTPDEPADDDHDEDESVVPPAEAVDLPCG